METVFSGASKQTSVEQLFEKEAEFRKETIYFIVIDRFFNGNRANDGISKQKLHDPSLTHWGHYWGGDLEGIIEKADYLKQLGITAVWLSPLFEHADSQSKCNRQPIEHTP